MAEPIIVDNGTLTDYNVLNDDVTDGTLGNGAVQYVKLMDGTINSTTPVGGTSNGLKVDQIRAQHCATTALTTVADSASSGVILATNSARFGAIITNDSSARLYLRLEAAAASTSNYAVSLAQHETYELPYGYTGEVRGIWATDPNDGAARVTEFSI